MAESRAREQNLVGNVREALAWYVVAKVCEHPLDAPLYATGQWLSGHTWKHLLAALGGSGCSGDV